MAPIIACTATGISDHVFDDKRMKSLHDAMQRLDLEDGDEDEEKTLLRSHLVSLARPYAGQWPFEEQVDLQMWIHPLNAIDLVLRDALENYPKLLLISPVPRNKNNKEKKSKEHGRAKPSRLVAPPYSLVEDLRVVLQFLANLLRNSFCKTIFNSIYELTDLLAASDESLSRAALTVIYNWVLPSQMHKQAGNHNMEQMHAHAQQQQIPQLPHVTQSRCMAMARAWGTRAQDLGLLQAATADAAFHWPEEPARVRFVYSPDVTVEIPPQQLLLTSANDGNTSGSDEQEHQHQKRRRVTDGTKSTAEIFTMAIDQINEKIAGQSNGEAPPIDPLRTVAPGQTHSTPNDDRLFSLLADIRLARSYKHDVLPAIQARLQALVSMLQTHPLQETVCGYFQAQPELIVELVELLRPTVSPMHIAPTHGRPDPVAHLSNAQSIPHSIRILAIEAFTALVARRDAGMGTAVSNEAPMSTVLTELGVGKGMYMGVLPTLLRYSIASITTATSIPPSPAKKDSATMEEDEAMDIGLAFLEATMGPQPPRATQVEEALLWLDAILNLTLAVVSTPAGTASLTESGVIPALLSAVALDTDKTVRGLLKDSEDQDGWIAAQLRFVTSLAVQILEGVIVAQSNAAAAFNDLHGVQVLIDRVQREMKVKPPTPSQRGLVFSIMTCLTVVFHQESTTTNATTLSGSNYLKQPALTDTIITILKYVPSYGGHLASLVATLLSDVLNHDPHVVHYVHESGIAEAFFDLIRGNIQYLNEGDQPKPILPPVPELIMAIPNVLAALALTEDGAKAVKEANPFPALCRLFYDPRYAMPASKCLLSEMTAIVGTGLEEIMRHVEGVKPLIMEAIVGAMNNVVRLGDELSQKEALAGRKLSPELETERSCLIQYVLNMGQLMEQVLHNDDHVGPFCTAGGFACLLALYKTSMPKQWSFLAHVSPLSSVPVSTLHHSTIEDSLNLALKCVFLKHKPKEILDDLCKEGSRALDNVQEACTDLGILCDGNLVASLPDVYLYNLVDEEMPKIARLLEGLAMLTWISGALSLALKATGRRMDDHGALGGPSVSSAEAAEWRAYLASPSFGEVISRLVEFQRKAIWQVCHARASTADKPKPVKAQSVRYRLRIVCPEGAVVRDGIEIDSCASVGSMEMGEIADGLDRCINSSGILRYQTPRGWISEMTRGQGREPITEVANVWEISDDCLTKPIDQDPATSSKRIECSLLTMSELGVGILARMQRTYGDILTSMSRLVVQCFRTMGTRNPSFDEGSQGAQVISMLNLLHSPLNDAIDVSKEGGVLSPGSTMYYGCILDQLLSCLFFDERRERRMVNFLLLVQLVGLDTEVTAGSGSLFGCISYVFDHCLEDFDKYRDGNHARAQRVSHSVASSLPPVIKFLRRLVSTPISSSPVATLLSRIKWKHLKPLLGSAAEKQPPDEFFQPEDFVKVLHLRVSEVVRKAWVDPRFAYAPPHLIHPAVSLIGDVIVGLEEFSKKKKSSRSAEPSRTLLSDWIRETNRLEEVQRQQAESFEPSEEAITRLEEMGFTRDHALDALEQTRTNRIEMAMEYALSHPAPDAATAARRREEREQRRQQRQAETNNESQGEGLADGNNENGNSIGDNNSIDNTSGTGGDGGRLGPGAETGSSPSMEVDSTPPEDRDITSALESWVDIAPTRCLAILATSRPEKLIAKHPDGDAESEALTVVLAAFLLDLYHRYSDQQDKLVLALFDEFKIRLEAGDEYTLSRLAHAVALFVKALPKIRILMLRKGLISPIVDLLGVMMNSDEPDLPMWLPHLLLILDTMAQPVVAFSEADYNQERLEGTDICADYFDVLDDHKKQRDAVAKEMIQAFRALGKASLRDDQAATDPMQTEETPDSATKAMPAYFPLLPLRSVDICLKACRKLIGCGAIDKIPPPRPGVLQACLMLLLHLLRTPAASLDCLRGGIVETILSLPAESRFTGNSGLVTLILRRLLEDETTLLAAMETEIRTTITKLGKKDQPNSSAKAELAAVPLKAFMEAATPLLCRDASAFLKAMTQTLKIQDPKTQDPKVMLLPVSKKQSAPSDSPPTKPEGESTPSKPRRKSLGSSRRRSSSGSKIRSSSKSGKRGKRDKTEPQREEYLLAPVTPAAVITSQLIGQILNVDCSREPADKDSLTSRFLSQWELLGILSDLILALPACASSVHNFRPHRGKDKLSFARKISEMEHALSGAPCPTKTFVNFLLHVVLAQDRWALRNDEKIWSRQLSGENDDAGVIARKMDAARVLKTSQAAARVLLALCARPGEGRRRVIADLAFALSGGRLGHPGAQTAEMLKTPVAALRDSELNALNTWGELCLGLAVPRGGGKNLETTISINYEVVRTMFECGMVHSLMYSAQIVPIEHTMASSTLGTLLLPLELLTRASVSNYVAEMIKKEARGESIESMKSADVSEADAQPANDLVDRAEQGPYFMHMDAEEESSEEGGQMEESVEGEENEMSEDEDENGDEEMSEDDDDDEQSESEEDDDDEGSDEVTSEVDDEGAWNLDYENAFGQENPQPTDGEEVEDVGDHPPIDEGWTRIESSGFGGMLLGAAGINSVGVDVDGDRARGFIDAAEAMIGTLLRSGEINQDSLAEIEGQLGIRLMGGSTARRLQRQLQSGALGGEPGESLAARALASGGGPLSRNGRNGDIVGTLPHIHQRNQPDAGYSTFGGSTSGRMADLSSIEIVFGGPSVTSGSRNYDINAPPQVDTNEEEAPHITQLDLQLFPGGPASAAVARTQHSLHPLLCGIDLPPMNSLVMDLLPHGVRARRSGQMNTRRPGDWTNTSFAPGGFLVSTASGNIIRSNRSHAGAPLGAGLASRGVSGPIGWTDDGLPFDASVEELGSVLQAELTRSLREQSAAADLAAAAVQERSLSGHENSAMELLAEQAGHSSPDDILGEEQVSTAEQAGHSSPDDILGEVQEAGLAVDREEDSPSTGSEGERVASSLASGLRLSPSHGQSETIETSQSEELTEHGENAPTGPEGAETNLELERPYDSGADEEDEDYDGEEDGPRVHDEAEQYESSGGADAPEAAVREQGEDVLVCPPNIEPDVFHSLPREMQRDVVNEYTQSQDLAAQLDGTSLDPEVLAALPEDMRREIIEQERRERIREEQDATPVDPSRAEDMDNASFIASLAPELRADILITADEETLSSLPPNLIAEATVLRERAAQQRQRVVESNQQRNTAPDPRRGLSRGAPSEGTASHARKKPRTGKIKVEANRDTVIYLPENLSEPFSARDIQLLFRLFFLLNPIRPGRLLQKFLQNLCGKKDLRRVISVTLLNLLQERGKDAGAAIESYADRYSKEGVSWRSEIDSLFASPENFPPGALLGVAPEVPIVNELDGFSSPLVRANQGLGAAASVAANMPKITLGAPDSAELPPVVAARLIDTLQQLCKSSARFCVDSLAGENDEEATLFECMMDLIQQPRYLRSSGSLDQLFSLLETVVAPLSNLARAGEEEDALSKREVEAASAAGREWVDVPSVVIAPERLQALCSVLRMESCRESAFARVNSVLRRLCRVESNRTHVLAELALVAHSLGEDALRDLEELKIRMEEAASCSKKQAGSEKVQQETGADGAIPAEPTGNISSSVTFSTSTSETKLLRVLQTLHSMCCDSSDDSQGKKSDGFYVTEELVHLLRQLDFGSLWDELSSCLKIVQVLEGVATLNEGDEKMSEDNDGPEEGSNEGTTGNKKLRNSSAGLLGRFLPSIEAFFVATASASKPKESDKAVADSREGSHENIVGLTRLVDFVSENRILLNALVRNNPNLLERGFRALVQFPRCRAVLDFDVKRHWFKTQMRRLRQQASRRHGNIRLHINRKKVFEEAYHQLRLRNADEMRGRLHITFKDEEGIDAGGLSREFFAILAKEMFNPNYALFTSTEDGCTFQPNPNSSINPDHLSYFRFCGRIVGKAVADGYLLDAHFTRSLYKHMLGIKPSHHDMEAIDPDYYRNLKTILEYNLEDIGLELHFAIDDNSFGRSKVIDLVPNGRTVLVTEENKEKYVQLVCEHRMTTSIQNQIKAYLDGFYELVSPDLIAIFTPRELELVISGLPDIDVADLKKNTEYVGWKATDKEMEWFWSIMGSLSRNQKAAFVQFVTGSSKVPLAGFGELQGMRGIQKFSIHKATNSAKGALMSAHTCFNSLDLPVYKSEEEMREKLLYAINEGAGSFLFA